jgi:P27 family predicted phage terminase small subunit
MRAPRHLNTIAKAEWRRVMHELANVGLLTVVDRAALAAYCQAWAEWVQAEQELERNGRVLTTDKGYAYPSPWVAIRNNALDAMRKFAVEFGMTPSSRSRVKVQATEKELSLAETLFQLTESGK